MIRLLAGLLRWALPPLILKDDNTTAIGENMLLKHELAALFFKGPFSFAN